MWFTSEELAVLRRDTILDKLSVIKMPESCIDQMRNESGVTAQKDLKYDMHRLVHIMKEQEERVHNMTIELEIQYRKDSSILNEWWAYFNKPTGRGINFITGGILVILAVGIVYLWRRVSVLTTTVFVLTHTRKIQALELIYSPSLGNNLNNTDRDTKGVEDTVNMLLSNYRWYGFISMVMIGMVMLGMGYVVYLGFRKRRKLPKLCCHIGFNFACAGESKTLVLMECNTLIEDVALQAAQPPSHLFVEGYLRPFLTFEWDITVTIKSLQLNLAIPQRINLSWKEAKFVRGGIRTHYRVVPIIFSQDMVRVIRKTVTKKRKDSQAQLVDHQPKAVHAYVTMGASGEKYATARL